MNGIDLEPDHESFVLAMIRQLPEDNRDDAFRYVASRIRPVLEPTIIDIDRACREALKKYSGSDFTPRVVPLDRVAFRNSAGRTGA